MALIKIPEILCAKNHPLTIVEHKSLDARHLAYYREREINFSSPSLLNPAFPFDYSVAPICCPKDFEPKIQEHSQVFYWHTEKKHLETKSGIGYPLIL